MWRAGTTAAAAQAGALGPTPGDGSWRTPRGRRPRIRNGSRRTVRAQPVPADCWSLSRSRVALLCQPDLEALVDLVGVIRPEARIDLQCMLEVGGSCRQVVQAILRNQRNCILARRRVSNVFRQVCVALCGRGGNNELGCGVAVLRTHRNAPPFEVIDLAIPH